MKYAVLTYDGYGLPIAWQLQREGCDVVVGQVQDQAETLSELEKDVGTEDEETRERRLSLYQGLLDKQPADKLVERLCKAKDPGEWYVFCDLNHLYRYADRLRDVGLHGNFPTGDDYCYEIDRELAKNFVDQNYPMIRVADKRRFKKASEAKAFLERSEEMWVLKGLEEDARTVVPDVDDLKLAHLQIVDALEQHPDEYESAGFILELLIPNALELTPGKLYYNGDPVYTYMCLENKQLGAGNVGPMTDCAQDLVFATWMGDRINQIAFPPIVDRLARERKGAFYWDASIYIDPRTGKLYFGEFCANRPGYNCLYTEMTLAGGASRYFESVVACKNPAPESAVATSVRLFNFHKSDGGRPLDTAAIGYRERVESGLWLCDARKQGRRLVTAGYREDVAVLTGTGHSIGEAARRAYRNVDEFSLEGAYYRPLFDFVSKEYKTSLLNRLDYGLQRGFYKVGFGIG